MDSKPSIKQLSVHYVGNKGLGEELVQAQQPLALNGRDSTIISEALLAKFSTDMERFSFTNAVSLEYNVLYNLCLAVFAEEADFHKTTLDIARHLHESTTHPKIKAGELYVAHLQNCEIDGRLTEAIGIYKTESKSNFLDIQHEGHQFSMTLREGAELSKIDKGCLVFPTNGEKGFDIFLFDHNRGEEAVFWKETFLSVAPQANEYFQTNQFLTLTRQFISKQIPDTFEMEKTERIDLLNKSVEYFKNNEEFDKTDFVETVLQDDKLIRAFKQYEDDYSENNDVTFPDNFGISTQALKKQVRVFKSVLKLDKNFHIYIHGNRDLIEKGYDAETGRKYYKIYFDEEQ